MTASISEEKAEFAASVIAILDGWGVSNANKIILLALPSDTKPRALQRYQQGTPLPENEVIQERAEHLAGIAKALSLAYPRNAQGGELWLNRPSDHFNGRVPIAIMIQDGLTGITTVRMHVDCSYDWFMDEQKSRPSPCK